MAVYDGYQGKAAERRREKADPRRFTRTDIDEVKLRGGQVVERSAAPVAVSGSDVRTRQSIRDSGIEPDAPPQQDYVDPEYPHFRMSQAEYENHMRKKQQRLERERAEMNKRAEAERVRLAREAENQRVAELMKQKEQWQGIARTLQSRLIEENLTQSQIIMVMESMSATSEEIAVIGPRLRAQGTHLLVDMWVSELTALRNQK